jgi:hypothetical protein
MAEKGIWPEFEFACNGGGGCVIVKHIAGAGVVISDSKNPCQPGLVFSRKEYADFRRRVQGGSWPRIPLRYAVSALRSATLILRYARD